MTSRMTSEEELRRARVERGGTGDQTEGGDRCGTAATGTIAVAAAVHITAVAAAVASVP